MQGGNMKTNELLFQDNLTTIFLIDSIKYGKHEIYIDTEDWDKVKQYRWIINYDIAEKRLKSVNTIIRIGLRKLNKKKCFKLHKFITNYKMTDHINCNVCDNRKSNLRPCNHTQNMRNVTKYRNNKSGYRGVCWDKYTQKWLAQIKVNDKRIKLGRYIDKQQAALIYNQVAQKYFGEFALLNSIGGIA
jgi:hypothetical protein